MHPTRLLASGAAALALLVGPTAVPAHAVDRVVHSDVLRVDGRMVFTMDVSPGHAQRLVAVQKRACARTCPWRTWRWVRTDAAGRARHRITAPRTGSDYWRWMVPPSDGYPRSWSGVWRTFRR